VLQSFFQEGGKVKDFDYEEKLPIGVDPGATGKDPTRNLGNALHYIRQSIVLKELRHYTPRGTPSVYLDVGCSDGSLIGLQAVIELGGFLGSFAYIGSDLRYTACKQFCQTTGQSTFQADASTAMPVHEATIDCIIFVEILEHVEDPLAAMQEISRVLKPGGRLIIATGNRHGVGLGHCLSPIIVLEKMLALVVDDLLPPRYMLEDLGGIPCWHTEFSRAEMIALGKACGFHIVSMAGYHYLPGVERYVERICRSRLHVRKYARIINAIETVWRLIPVVKLLGEHWYVVMEKADQGK
jgi:SAM-dependent methyltransferase